MRSHTPSTPARLLVPALAALSALLLLAPFPARAAGPLRVVATFSILGDMVKNVAGDRVELATLVGPDTDTHVYEPTPSDARTLAKADLVFVNGLGFEGWMDRLVESSGCKGQVVVVSKGVKPRTMIDEDEGGKEVVDPHAWQDLTNGAIYVANIEKALVKADPANAAFYTANAEAYLKKIKETDDWVRAEFAAIPAPRRRIITSHDAFGYFGQAYGVIMLAPEGFSTDAEASARGVSRLIRQIRSEKISALFVENMSDPRLIERIAKETGVRPGGELYSDALSRPGEGAATYLEMFRNNVTKMVAAMTGSK
ncbi:ABC-type metal ion transporter, periplasmic subunit [Desulfovibrio sp. X2]|uniref:metal ABC transporter substrate-binding protein n=1 Tax=Desulfovibrio sp. X2 TaxID=941449 RepID=UPI00035881BE|nr:metal ABC transporter substrate-binding protein [Desulfovibrio sp. X2]EPR44280.1 ABC-type metal ion transporter, periplasmic subunit [Desulfovibrio sp. X2]